MAVVSVKPIIPPLVLGRWIRMSRKIQIIDAFSKGKKNKGGQGDDLVITLAAVAVQAC